jgi:hypothetical protein
VTDSNDQQAARANAGVSTGVTDTYDFNKDGVIDANDQQYARISGTFLDWISGSALPGAIAAANAQNTAVSATNTSAAANVAATTSSAPFLTTVRADRIRAAAVHDASIVAVFAAPTDRIQPAANHALDSIDEQLLELLAADFKSAGRSRRR